MATADIFLSYAHEDMERARSLAAALTAEGWNVFWDRRIPPGRTFEDYIEQRLHECKAIVVMWSPHGVISKWVRIEAAVGREREILVPVLTSPATLPFGYGQIHAADLTRWVARTRSRAHCSMRVRPASTRRTRTHEGRSGREGSQ